MALEIDVMRMKLTFESRVTWLIQQIQRLAYSKRLRRICLTNLKKILSYTQSQKIDCL